MLVALVGLGAGVVLSVPSTGPVDLLVLRHVLAGDPRRGLRIAVGSGLADVPYAWLGALGYGWTLARSPVVAAGLDLLGAALLVGVAVHLARAPLGVAPAPDDAPPAGDVLTGLVLGLLNASRILTWSVTASVLAAPLAGAGPVDLGAYAACAAAGEVLWFALVAALRARLGPASLAFHRWTVRGGAALGVVLAAGLAVRSVRALLGP